MKCLKIILCLLFFGSIVLADDSLEDESNKIQAVMVQPQNFSKNPLLGVKIVGGSQARDHQFPWQASIITCQGDDCQICGGSLISRQFVLTAAHCTDGIDSFDIRLGSSNFQKPAVKLTATVKYQHPSYNRSFLSNDITLIKLPRRVNLSEAIQTISLANGTIGDLNGKTAIVSGFGKTSGMFCPFLNFNLKFYLTLLHRQISNITILKLS